LHYSCCGDRSSQKTFVTLQARAVELLADAAVYCDDETRLQRIVPYLLVIS